MHRRPPSKDSYLNIPAIVAACEITGADAVHPGYGFLAENARFAEILEEHAITFIGPTAEHVRMMGDKIVAKDTARTLGIPVVPGSGPVGDIEEAKSLRPRHRLSDHGQGLGRRRRTRHEARARREPARARAPDRAQRGARRLRRRHRLSREISRPSPPYRGAGAGRRARQRHPSRRARLLAPAAPSEALGGSPLARSQRKRAQPHRRDGGEGDARSLPIAASAPSSFSTRTASSTSSR